MYPPAAKDWPKQLFSHTPETHDAGTFGFDQPSADRITHGKEEDAQIIMDKRAMKKIN